MNVSIGADQACKVNMTISDVNGKVIYTNSISVAQGSTNLIVKLNNIAAGIYILKLQFGSDLIIKRFTKK